MIHRDVGIGQGPNAKVNSWRGTVLVADARKAEIESEDPQAYALDWHRRLQPLSV